MAAAGLTERGLGMDDFVSLGNCSSQDVRAILDLAKQIKGDPGGHTSDLAGKSVILLFEKPSLRTRVAFEVGIQKLGGHALFYDHSAQRIGERESIHDYAKNLERWVDAIVARTFSHETIQELAAHARVPVVNALSKVEHPCQALADLMTMDEHLGSLEGKALAYVGDGNNVCHALALGCAHLGVNLQIITPEGYEAEDAMIERAREIATGSVIEASCDIGRVAGADAVYTDVWSSMGDSESSEDRRAAFEPYRIDAALMARAGADALFMHCLPAKRGVEVTDEVIDSPHSVVFDQAENRMHTQNALLSLLLAR